MADGVRVVATDNADVARHLAAPALTRAGVTCRIVADRAALLAAVASDRPAVVLVDAALPAGDDGFDACRAIKDDPALRPTRVAMMIRPGELDRTAALALARSGCDDVIAPPLSFDDFCVHLSRLSPVPMRRDRRIAVDLEVELAGRAIRAQIANVGTGGVGLRLDAPLPIGGTVTARPRIGSEITPATAATVAWCRPITTIAGEDKPTYAAGLTWVGEPPLRTRLLLEQVALFEVEPGDERGAVAVTLHGDFTELTRFDALAAQLATARAITFDLATVRYLSSAGVRAWCELIGGLTHARLSFRHCSIAFTSQAGMVPLVLAGGTVRSFEAPYYCEACGLDDARLLEVGSVARDGDHLAAPRLACARCGGPSDLDDVPERYFAFLAAP